ncbi:MAG TPA: threonine synthase [Polyangia bacterium]|nr:threonine synthase [Polyangia bacterium]
MNSCLDHLECTYCGARFPADALHGLCTHCQRVLYPRYDLAAAARTLTRDALARRPPGLWRYREVLPVRDPAHILSLGEGGTPLLPARRFGESLGLPNLWIKDEGQNPTGSFKARGLSAALSRAHELGVRKVALPSAGNAAAATAAYAARGGMEAFVFMPSDSPPVHKAECDLAGARLFLVNGLIHDAGAIVQRYRDRCGWFDVSTLKEPYRVEGKKTMGYELLEQMGWELPDVIVYPTGGGTGIVGMWKAFAELEALGLCDRKRPRMVSVQAAGCAPITKAFEEGKRHAEPWPSAATIAPGIRVPVAVGDYLILDAIRASGGTAISVDDRDILAAVAEVARLEGIYGSPEAGATAAACRVLARRGLVKPDERVVLLFCGSGLLHTELVRGDYPVLDPRDPKLERYFSGTRA